MISEDSIADFTKQLTLRPRLGTKTSWREMKTVLLHFRFSCSINKRISFVLSGTSPTILLMKGANDRKLILGTLLKDNMKFTPQIYLAVKGQNPWVCP